MVIETKYRFLRRSGAVSIELEDLDCCTLHEWDNLSLPEQKSRVDGYLLTLNIVPPKPYCTLIGKSIQTP